MSRGGALVLGYASEDWANRDYGVWKDEVFHPFDDDTLTRCRHIADNDYIVCEGPNHAYPFVARLDFSSSPPGASGVQDLTVTEETSQSITVRWTQIDDGTGQPARYRVKYASPPIHYPTATRACTLRGDQIGADASCTIDDLQPGTTYEIQLMSYRLVNGQWADAVESNVVTGRTGAGGGPGVVGDLEVVAIGNDAIGLRWTQVDDGTGHPARYRVKYGTPIDDWSDATIGCAPTIHGTAIGAEMTCTVEGLEPDTHYELQLMSFRVENGAWQDARYSNKVSAVTDGGGPQSVDDLEIVSTTSTTMTVRWTQIDDGSDPDGPHPARYRVKYAESPLTSWSNATIGCDRTIVGDEVGAPISCTIEGLQPGTTYDVQLMSFWVENGAWRDARYSNLTTGSTAN